MAATASTSERTAESTRRWLHTIGTCGTVLALTILAASMLLRLTSHFGSDGQVISTLSATLENTIRMTHRLAASGVGLLALGAVFLYWARRPLPATVVMPITSMVAATIVLAIIGPLTPGYRIAAITIVNVGVGMVLLMAFWWLREAVATPALVRKSVEPLLRATIYVFLVHIATGAAASADEMHGMRGFALLHLGTALLAFMFIGASIWARRREPSLAGWTKATTALLVAQVAFGLVLMWLGTRPVWLAYLHGMLSPLLAIALVSLAARDRTPPWPSK